MKNTMKIITKKQMPLRTEIVKLQFEPYDYLILFEKYTNPNSVVEKIKDYFELENVSLLFCFYNTRTGLFQYTQYKNNRGYVVWNNIEFKSLSSDIKEICKNKYFKTHYKINQKLQSYFLEL